MLKDGRFYKIIDGEYAGNAFFNVTVDATKNAHGEVFPITPYWPTQNWQFIPVESLAELSEDERSIVVSPREGSVL